MNGRPTLVNVVAAERTKLLALRSTWSAAVLTDVAAGALTYLDATASSSDPGFDPVRSLTTGVPVAAVGLLVLGVLVGTGEFSSGSFRSTFVVVPRRLRVLAAQAVVTAGFATAVAVMAVAASIAGVLPAAASRGITPDLGTDGVPTALAGSAVLLVGTALVGHALGAWLRRPVVALVVAVGISLVLPLVLLLAVDLTVDPLAGPAAGNSTGPSAVEELLTWTPSGAGASLTSQTGSATEGILVLAGWVLLPLAAAAIRWRRRDLV